MVDLKPCPFCGGNAEKLDLEDEANFGGSVICCQKCEASSPVHFDRKENLYDSWNRRTEAKQDDEPVAWQWRAYEDGGAVTDWHNWDWGDRRGWEAIAKHDPGKYEVRSRPLYTRPSEQAVTEAMVEAAQRIRDVAMRQTIAARLPECGEFGGIAQDADWLVDALKAAMEVGHADH